jgi:micrococcal nuclease
MIFAKKRSIVLILVILSIDLTFCNSRDNPEAADTFYKVVKVVDGDTFWIDDGTQKGKKIRLIGVDAPETRRTSRKDVGFYGQESKKYLTNLILNREVRLEYDVDRKDRYGRTLAYVYLKDGTFVNAEIVKRGFGMVMTVPPNVKFAETFLDFQREARERERGLWKK